ncbi:MAG: sodium:solute symporter family transporter [Acutalibacteraceae bacterium]
MCSTTDAVVPALAIEILPIGLTGLALAGILSVIMSTADSYLIVSVQSCVHDVYKSFKPDVGEKELILTRVFAVIMPLGALLIAISKTPIIFSCLHGAFTLRQPDFLRLPHSIGLPRQRSSPEWLWASTVPSANWRGSLDLSATVLEHLPVLALVVLILPPISVHRRRS